MNRGPEVGCRCLVWFGFLRTKMSILAGYLQVNCQESITSNAVKASLRLYKKKKKGFFFFFFFFDDTTNNIANEKEKRI